jgi:hypothetical protein
MVSGNHEWTPMHTNEESAVNCKKPLHAHNSVTHFGQFDRTVLSLFIRVYLCPFVVQLKAAQ